mmetsp:Transcript_25763/g.60171  ORF Transcript_25763/g.60171 Transcript_25763/m.60171 type:complete len:509 (+) Transcript_25763:107-1633(+)
MSDSAAERAGETASAAAADKEESPHEDPLEPVVEDGSSDSCPICFEPVLNKGEATLTTSCGHRFHFPCIRKWLPKGFCPMCRSRTWLGEEECDSNELEYDMARSFFEVLTPRGSFLDSDWDTRFDPRSLRIPGPDIDPYMMWPSPWRPDMWRPPTPGPPPSDAAQTGSGGSDRPASAHTRSAPRYPLIDPDHLFAGLPAWQDYSLTNPGMFPSSAPRPPGAPRSERTEGATEGDGPSWSTNRTPSFPPPGWPPIPGTEGQPGSENGLPPSIPVPPWGLPVVWQSAFAPPVAPVPSGADGAEAPFPYADFPGGATNPPRSSSSWRRREPGPSGPSPPLFPHPLGFEPPALFPGQSHDRNDGTRLGRSAQQNQQRHQQPQRPQAHPAAQAQPHALSQAPATARTADLDRPQTAVPRERRMPRRYDPDEDLDDPFVDEPHPNYSNYMWRPGATPVPAYMPPVPLRPPRGSRTAQRPAQMGFPQPVSTTRAWLGGQDPDPPRARNGDGTAMQ